MATDDSASAVIITERDGNIVFANKNACEIFGYALFEILGLNVDVLVPDRHQQRHADYRRSFSASPSARTMGKGRELYGKHGDGHEFPVEVSLTLISKGDNRLIMATVIDVSRRETAETAGADTEQMPASV